MRYHRLRVRNFRRLSDVTVSFPEGQLLVIEGPNEAGKSSIVEAIGLLFEFTAESSAEEVRRVRPLGRDADPEVELEFTAGGVRCRYRKAFGRRGATELEMFGPTSKRLSGREAHDEAKRLLRETTDEALLRTLRVLQGESLAPPNGIEGSIVLQRALDAGAADAAGESLFERARKECARYFTERVWRETGELKEARDAHREAARRADEVASRVRRLDELAELVAERERQASAQREEIHALRSRYEQLEGKRVEREAAAQAAELAKRDLVAARERQQRLEEEVRRRLATKQERRELEQDLGRIEVALAEKRTVADEAKARAVEARGAAKAARQRFELLERNAVTAERDLVHLQEELQLAQMEERLRDFDEASSVKSAAEAFLADCRVNREQLSMIERAEAEVARTEAQLQATAARVEVEGPAGATVVVDGVETPLVGGLLQLEASEERRVELPGGYVVIVRPSQSQQLLEKRAIERRDALKQLLAAAGATSVEHARELERKRGEALHEIENAENRRRTALRDLKGREELAGKIERTRKRVEEYRASLGSRPLPPSIEAARAERDASEREREAARSAQEVAEQAAQAAGDAAAAAEREVAALEVQVTTQRQRLEQLKATLDQWEAEMPTARLEADLAASRGEAKAAESKKAEAEAKVDELADAAKEAQRIASLLASAEADLEESERFIAEGRGALRHEGEGTLQSELDEATARLEEAAMRLQAVERRARAARLLYETLERHREEARRAYGPRLEARLAALGRRVFGEDFAVHLDGQLAPAERSLGGERLPIEQLSVGAREQIAVLYRAACAAAAAEDGVPFFLDDALGWSDEARLNGMVSVLEEVAREVQVVVLTCQPERFAAAAGAAVVHIQDGRTAEAGQRDSGQAALFDAAP